MPFAFLYVAETSSFTVAGSQPTPDLVSNPSNLTCKFSDTKAEAMGNRAEAIADKLVHTRAFSTL